MERDKAIRLVRDLERHPPLTEGILPQKQDLIRLLISTEVPESRRFYEEVIPNEQTIDDSANSKEHSVSVRRILRNKLADDYEMSFFKNWYDAVVSSLGAYDSNVIARRLRADRDLVNLMQQAYQSGQPYSLLAKLETVDALSGSIETRPLIVIPNSSNMPKVLAWESAHTNRVSPELQDAKNYAKTKR